MQRRTLLTAAALVVLTIAAYLPALRNGFVWDDDDHLTQNTAVAAPDGLRQIWSSLRVSRYYPLTLTTFWAERHLWDLHPLPYHAVNVAIHAVNAVLLFLVLRRLQVRAAWFAAALWAVHPVTVESVAWVTELKNTQSALFFFLSLLCWLRFEQRPQPGWFAGALVCFAAALTSKPSTVMLPVVLLLCAWWQRQRLTRTDFLRALPFFLLSIGMSLLTIEEQQRNIRGAEHGWSLSLAQRLVVAGNDLWFYCIKLVWPRPLMFVYPLWRIDASALWSWLPWLGAALLALLWWRRRRDPDGQALQFGLGYFVVSLAPVLGILDVYYFRYSFVADHFQYLASAGPLALVAAAGAALVPRAPLRIALAGVALLALGGLTWQHAQVFRNNEVLWRDTLAKNPDADLAHNNLGTILLAQGQRLAPGPVQSTDNLGSLSKAQPIFREAEMHLRRALQLDPRSAEIHNNLGAVLAALGEYSSAAAEFSDALRLKPDFLDASVNFAGALAREGKVDEAIAQDRHSLTLAPNSVEVNCNLARRLLAAGRTEDAIQYLSRTVELQPDFADGYLELGRQYRQRGQYREALQTYRHALEALPRPHNLHLVNDWAWLLATSPDPQASAPEVAIQVAEHLADQTQRKVPEILDTLAACYAASASFDEAVSTAQEARALALQQHSTKLAADIEKRIDLYQSHKPFVLEPKTVTRDP